MKQDEIANTRPTRITINCIKPTQAQLNAYIAQLQNPDGEKSLHRFMGLQENRIVDLSRMKLVGRNLSGADLSGANLMRTDLSRTDLFEANLSGAYLQHARFLETNLMSADLTKANLQNTHFFLTVLESANLSEADFRYASLSKTNCTGANFSGANLSKALLFHTNFYAANLSEANLFEVDLKTPILTAANLYKANLCEVKNLSHAKFDKANLIGVKGLTSEQLSDITKSMSAITDSEQLFTQKLPVMQIYLFAKSIHHYAKNTPNLDPDFKQRCINNTLQCFQFILTLPEGEQPDNYKEDLDKLQKLDQKTTLLSSAALNDRNSSVHVLPKELGAAVTHFLSELGESTNVWQMKIQNEKLQIAQNRKAACVA